MSKKFTKHDAGKPMITLIEPQFIKGIAEILTFGANKYEKGNWQKCDDVSRYEDALLRHMYAYLDGEENDPETGKSHLYHVGCCLMFVDYFRRNKDVKSK